jgi:hypothetical protein
VNETVKVGKGRKEQVVWVWGVVMVRQGRRKKKESEASSFIRCLPWVISPPLSFTRHVSAVYLQK